VNFIPDPNPEHLTVLTLPRNVLSLEAFQINSVHSPVVPWLPCPDCHGQGIVGDDQYNEDCVGCGGSGEVPIVLHDALVADADQAWEMR
jgi:hypothetical protein